MPPQRPDKIMEAICILLENREKANQMGAKGRVKAKESYDLEQNLNDLISIYDQTISSENTVSIL